MTAPVALLDALDRRVSLALMDVDHPGLDRVMRHLSAAADHSKIWVATAGVIGVAGDATARRSAVRGIAAAALASLVTNQGLKRLLPRRRPADLEMSLARTLRRVPSSSSFPSGHSASAAAFAVGVSPRTPAGRAVLYPLALAVAYSRAHAGVHHPSDVLVGLGVGAGVGAFVVRRDRSWLQAGPGAGGLVSGRREG